MRREDCRKKRENTGRQDSYQGGARAMDPGAISGLACNRRGLAGKLLCDLRHGWRASAGTAVLFCPVPSRLRVRLLGAPGNEVCGQWQAPTSRRASRKGPAQFQRLVAFPTVTPSVTQSRLLHATRALCRIASATFSCSPRHKRVFDSTPGA